MTQRKWPIAFTTETEGRVRLLSSREATGLLGHGAAALSSCCAMLLEPIFLGALFLADQEIYLRSNDLTSFWTLRLSPQHKRVRSGTAED